MQGIRIYQPPIEPDDEITAEHARILTEAMPFSIIGSTEEVTTADGRKVKGREYLWGVAEGTSPSRTLNAVAYPTVQLRTRTTAISVSCARC